MWEDATHEEMHGHHFELQRPYWIRLRRALGAALTDIFAQNIDYRSAAVSFFTLISIVPLLVVITTILSLLPFDATYLWDSIRTIFPKIPFDVQHIVSLLTEKRSLYGWISFGFAYFFATALFRALYHSLMAIFGKSDRLLKQSLFVQFVSVPVFILALFIIYFGGSFVINGFFLLIKFPFVKGVVDMVLPNIPSVVFSLIINVGNVINFLTFFLILFLIYHSLAPRDFRRLRNSFVLTFIIAILFTGLKHGLEHYLVLVAKLNPFYGAFSGIFGFLVWLFFSFNLILIGARAIYYLEDATVTGTVCKID